MKARGSSGVWRVFWFGIVLLLSWRLGLELHSRLSGRAERNAWEWQDVAEMVMGE